MAEIFRTRSSAEWLQALDENDVPSAPVLKRVEMFENPQILHNKIISDVEQPGVGEVKQARPAAQFSVTPASPPRPAPRLGEHSIEILSEIDFSREEINALIETNVVIQYPI